MLKLALMGSGRMGTLIQDTAQKRSDEFEIVAQIGFDLTKITEAPAADVLIDFSHPSCLDAVCNYVERFGCALVSGTTGYTDKDMQRLQALSAYAPVIWSGNYSLGVAVLRHLVTQAARELTGFDTEIVEMHHNQKVDAPSGTAHMLLESVIAGKEDPQAQPVYGRTGQVGARSTHEIGVHAVRGGTVAGVHTVGFFGIDEEITLTHRATSRQIFVQGALAAAARIVTKPRGFYTFDELMF